MSNKLLHNLEPGFEETKRFPIIMDLYPSSQPASASVVARLRPLGHRGTAIRRRSICRPAAAKHAGSVWPIKMAETPKEVGLSAAPETPSSMLIKGQMHPNGKETKEKEK